MRVDWISTRLGITDPNGAAFWPRLRLPDPLNNYNLRTFAPSGVVAGVYATTDGSRGVWKAPAGINATLNGVQGLTYTLTDQENGLLNPLGLNCFRSFPVYGRVLWGARTLQGADALASQWKYVPVRRMALFLEESLYRGLKWVVFEPNDEPLWAAIRLNVESFMQTLFLKGAFQGTTPAQAYFVKCDSETTTQTDIDNGIVNILVGFAPLEPAEFVVIQIEQLTGQACVLGGSMAEFTANPQRFDPYKNFKFRLKWDGRYVAGVSKVSALKRTTEVVEHREGGDPSTSRKSPGRTEVRGDHPRAGRHPRPRVRGVGGEGLADRRGPRRRGIARGLPQGRHHSTSSTRPASSRSATRSTGAGSASTRRCPTWTPTRTRSPSSTSRSRTRAGTATPR